MRLAGFRETSVAWPILQLSVDDLAQLLVELPTGRRRIESIHLHHSGTPSHTTWRGTHSMAAMWQLHVEERGLKTLAQHLTIDPAGGLWLGRPFDWAPASCLGNRGGQPWNGDAERGPLMLMLIGNFADGHDVLAGAQRAAFCQTMAVLLAHYHLEPAAIITHAQMRGCKVDCPGGSLTVNASGMLYDDILRDIASASASLQQAGKVLRLPLPEALQDLRHAPPGATRVILGDADRAVPEDASAAATLLAAAQARAFGSGGAGQRGAVDPAHAGLFGHVVNSARGLLLENAQQASSKNGAFFTSQDELEGRFYDRLIRHVEALPEQSTIKLMLHAHGGLVSETDALGYASRHCDWWLQMGVFPLFFVWETGLLETLLERRRDLELSRGWLDGLFDRTDWLIEKASSPAGTLLWKRMKANAELGASENWLETYRRLGGEQPPAWVGCNTVGGARLFVRSLLAILERVAGRRPIEIHAVGHSAGSIWHAHLLPMLLAEAQRRPRLSAFSIASLQMLAPAVRIDDFERLLGPALQERSIARLLVYTMEDRRERDDHTGWLYRKSLLYLVNEAFESDDEPGLLGLERCLTARRRLTGSLTAKLFAQAHNAVHLSKEGDPPDARTTATSHGGFDEDATTMASVAHVITGHAFGYRPRAVAHRRSAPRQSAVDLGYAASAAPAAARATGSRRALCIGIDAYPAPYGLSGCTNDARRWARELSAIGFDVRLLLDAEASRKGLIAAVQDWLRDAGPGDQRVLQLAGHGTQFADTGDDEIGGFDQAYVPQDFSVSGCLLDDELRALLAPAADNGVQITVCFDTCHSGTATRMAPLAAALAPAAGRRARFLPATPAMTALQWQISGRPGMRGGRSRAAVSPQRDWVHLAACQDHQLAYESDGSGDFTRAAAPLLGAAQSGGWTAARFLSEVLRAFPAAAHKRRCWIPARKIACCFRWSGRRRLALEIRLTGPR